MKLVALFAAAALAVSSANAAATQAECTASTTATASGPAFNRASLKCQTSCFGKMGTELETCIKTTCKAEVDVCNFLTSTDGAKCCDYYKSVTTGDKAFGDLCDKTACTPSATLPEYNKCYGALFVDAGLTTEGLKTATNEKVCKGMTSANGKACCTYVNANPNSWVATEGAFKAMCDASDKECSGAAQMVLGAGVVAVLAAAML